MYGSFEKENKRIPESSNLSYSAKHFRFKYTPSWDPKSINHPQSILTSPNEATAITSREPELGTVSVPIRGELLEVGESVSEPEGATLAVQPQAREALGLHHPERRAVS